MFSQNIPPIMSQPTQSQASANGGKIKKMKDPNAPKKAMGSYMHFIKVQSSNLSKEYPGLTTAERAKKAGEIWN